MDIVHVSSDNFDEEVYKCDKKVLVDFYANWCGPCKMLTPIIEDFAKNNDDVKVVKINVDEQQDLAMEYQVMSIPTLIVMEKGKELNRSIGLIDKTQIEELIK